MIQGFEAAAHWRVVAIVLLYSIGCGLIGFSAGLQYRLTHRAVVCLAV